MSQVYESKERDERTTWGTVAEHACTPFVKFSRISGEIVGVIALCADVTAESTQNPQSNDPGTIFRV